MTKPFDNLTNDGNEPAIKRGHIVPDGDVNLAYVKSPELSPENNIVIVDTSRLSEDNASSEQVHGCKLYYSNAIGVLVDEDDNVVVSDEYPVVTDEFVTDENYSIIPGAEYTDSDILPYVHVSRHFHLDHAGLTIAGDTVNYRDESIKVVNNRGIEYSKYRIKIAAAYLPGVEKEGGTWAYRIFAYVDTDSNEELYLTYNKTELDDATGNLIRRKINYKEILNPRPFFKYRPEESEVVDAANRNEKIYSTKPVSLKDKILDKSTVPVDGYKVYVPKKAVGDPRLYQLFRWRVTCNFKNDYTVDPSRDTGTIRCGIVVTNNDINASVPTRAPYALYNLSRSRYNAKSLAYKNPLKTNHSDAEQKKRSYWFVNIDTDDLSQFDLLIWAPSTLKFDFTPYAAKMNHFVSTLGGTLFIDTNNWSYPNTSLGGLPTVGINAVTGKPRQAVPVGAESYPANPYAAQWGDIDNDFTAGDVNLGGWSLFTGLEERLFFNPDHGLTDYSGSAKITRGMFCQVIVNMMKNIDGFVLPARKVNAFPDVKAGTPYRAAIETLAAFNPPIVQGYTNGYFNPTRGINRAGTASVLDRAYAAIDAQFTQLSPLANGSVAGFSDVDSNYIHAPAIGRMALAGIMNGYPGGLFKPTYISSHQQLGNEMLRMIFLLENSLNERVSRLTNNSDLFSMSFMQNDTPRYTQHFHNVPTGYTRLINARSWSSSVQKAVTIYRKSGKGTKVLSTFSQTFTCSALFSHVDGKLVSNNLGSTHAQPSGYERYINAASIEGAMKLLYNISLSAVRGRLIDNTDEEVYSSSWAYSTPWKSSWVIDASDNVLSRDEIDEHDFNNEPRDTTAGDGRVVWKRRLSTSSIKELMDIEINKITDPVTRQRTQGADRSYTIEVTNPVVETTQNVIENDYPKAWTEAYTPKFTVPVELGPHVIKEEFDSSGRRGRKAQYDEGRYTHIEYPSKPYAAQVISTFASSEEFAVKRTVTYTATATAVGAKPATTATATSSSMTSAMSWWDERVAPLSSATRGDPYTEGTMWTKSTSKRDKGYIKPVGIRNWQWSNYRSSAWGPGALCWPHWSMHQRLARGSSGDTVKFLQDALNRFHAAKYFNAGRKLNVDGIFGSLTEAVVTAFQTSFAARFIDGVVDAESWFLIGAQINRLKADGRFPATNSNNWTGYYNRANRMQEHRISDGNNNTWLGQRSWRKGGPSVIWDLYAIDFGTTKTWSGLTIIPRTEGDANSIIVNSIHVVDGVPSLVDYNSQSGQLRYMNYRPQSGKSLYIPFGPYKGRSIIVGIGQDRSSGYGSSRMFGIQEIRGHTTVSTPVGKVKSQNDPVTATVTGTVVVESFKNVTVQMKLPKFTGYTGITHIVFTGITVNDPEVSASIINSGLASFETQVVTDNSSTDVTAGTALPSGTYYSMDPQKRLNPVPETGRISKADGVKLLCDANKKPIGFPGLPTGVGANEAQRHYVNLAIKSNGTDASVDLGFYDVNQQEFVTSPTGKAEISYLEYINRGPQNIYIAAVTDYEEASEQIIPVDSDAPLLPHRWAMPVYGVCTKAGAKITLEPLPRQLGTDEVWPIAVREGRFSRNVQIRSRSQGPLTGWEKDYQGTNLTAFYSLPEAELGGYSTKFGSPYSDVIGEEPIILDDDHIQVRQAPIHLARIPTPYGGSADPVRPIMDVYRRASRSDPWIKLPFSEIRDYNTSTGEIFLVNRLLSNDSSLIKVDYTTDRKNYHFKQDDTRSLNLNIYSGFSRDLIDKALYVYIVPHYVKDSVGNVIAGSKEDRTLRTSTVSDIFDPLSPTYQPLAVLLGVVYLSSAVDIDKIAVLDTRRRGGGIRDNANVQEIVRMVSEAATYWDIGYGASTSYQKSGYVIVRLPAELKGQFTESEIVDIIERNMTAGVGFKLEDLNGRGW